MSEVKAPRTSGPQASQKPPAARSKAPQTPPGGAPNKPGTATPPTVRNPPAETVAPRNPADSQRSSPEQDNRTRNIVDGLNHERAESPQGAGRPAPGNGGGAQGAPRSSPAGTQPSEGLDNNSDGLGHSFSRLSGGLE